jgi:hypothetical protein
MDTGRFTRSRTLPILLVLVGAYVLVQPFDASPLTCFKIWPDPLAALRNCATGENLAAAFWAALVVGGVGVVAGAAALMRR